MGTGYTRAREKIKERSELAPLLRALQKSGNRVVFTNGCFDLIHPGHVRYLEQARTLGDILVVALNSDDSVLRLKGAGRPILSDSHRCEIVGSLRCVDYVTVFSEDTPLQIIEQLWPDVLVKGGDWPIDQIVGRATVEARGGRVVAIDFEEGFSTTSIINRIRGA